MNDFQRGLQNAGKSTGPKIQWRGHGSHRYRMIAAHVVVYWLQIRTTAVLQTPPFLYPLPPFNERRESYVVDDLVRATLPVKENALFSLRLRQ